MSDIPEHNTRFARRRERTRQLLLEAARRIFARTPLADVTTKMITEEADVGFGTFYLHFTTKEDIYAEIVQEGFAGLQTAIEEANTTTDDPLHRATTTIRAYHQYAYTHRTFFQTLALNGAAFAEMTGPAQRTREAIIARIMGNLTPLAEAGIIQIGPPELFGRIASAIFLQTALWWADHESPDPDAMSAFIANFFLFGIVPR